MFSIYQLITFLSSSDWIIYFCSFKLVFIQLFFEVLQNLNFTVSSIFLFFLTSLIWCDAFPVIYCDCLLCKAVTELMYYYPFSSILAIRRQLQADTTDLRLTCECTDELRDGTSDLLLRKRLHILRLMPSDPATDNMAISESLTIISEWSHTNGFIESLV